MKLTNQVRSISYLKAHAPDIIADVAETGNPVVITQRGEATAILQDIRSYEESQETLTLLKVLALTGEKVRQGDVLPAREAFAQIRKRLKR
ncbi:MAG TPA: type II toxin-antitoxin system Phd/YefM family antitoxin [Rhizomicrobium sp.]|jgi:prevent-host-death family protein|nr:type II toxin-antitoxin system Phd/YefM family antitoxin [Rhizomicrobium sp.]